MAAVNSLKLVALSPGLRSAPRKMFRVITLTGTLFCFFFASAAGTAARPVSATSAASAAAIHARRRIGAPASIDSLKGTPSDFAITPHPGAVTWARA